MVPYPVINHERLIEIVNSKLEGTGIRIKGPSKMMISRIEIFCNLSLSQSYDSYFGLFDFPSPVKKKKKYFKNTLYYKNKSESISIYDKAKELREKKKPIRTSRVYNPTEEENSKNITKNDNIARLELTIKGARIVKNKLGSKYLHDLSQDSINGYFKKNTATFFSSFLKINRPIPISKNETPALLEYFSTEKDPLKEIVLMNQYKDFEERLNSPVVLEKYREVLRKQGKPEEKIESLINKHIKLGKKYSNEMKLFSILKNESQLKRLKEIFSILNFEFAIPQYSPLSSSLDNEPLSTSVVNTKNISPSENYFNHMRPAETLRLNPYFPEVPDSIKENVGLYLEAGILAVDLVNDDNFIQNLETNEKIDLVGYSFNIGGFFEYKLIPTEKKFILFDSILQDKFENGKINVDSDYFPPLLKRNSISLNAINHFEAYLKDNSSSFPQILFSNVILFLDQFKHPANGKLCKTYNFIPEYADRKLLVDILKSKLNGLTKETLGYSFLDILSLFNADCFLKNNDNVYHSKRIFFLQRLPIKPLIRLI